MTAVTAGTSKTFTAQVDGSAFVVIAPGGAVGSVIDQNGNTQAIDPNGTRRTFGPLRELQSITVSMQIGNASVELDGWSGGIPITAETNSTGQTVLDDASAPVVKKLSSAGASMISVRYVNNVAFSNFDTSSFRQIFQVPVTGLVAVRAVYETDATSAVPAISNTAFAAGRSISDTNPLDASGSAAAWQVVTNTVVSAASASLATDGNVGVGKSAWVYMNIPAPTDGGQGGYVYVGTKLASGTAKGLVGNASRPTSDWGNTINALLPAMKYRAFYSAGDYVTTNQNAQPTTAEAYFNPVAQLDLIPLKKVVWGVNIGDSTSQGLGTGTPAVQPYNYNWAHVGAHARLQSGVAITVTNDAYEGKPSAFYLGTPGGSSGRLALLLQDADFYPSFVIIQPFSVNDGTFTQATVDAAILNALQLAQACRKRGILPILRTIVPASTTTLAQDNIRKAGNAAIVAAGEAIFDMDAVVTDGASPARMQAAYVQADGIHLNKAGNDAVGLAFARFLQGNGF